MKFVCLLVRGSVKRKEKVGPLVNVLLIAFSLYLRREWEARELNFEVIIGECGCDRSGGHTYNVCWVHRFNER